MLEQMISIMLFILFLHSDFFNVKKLTFVYSCGGGHTKKNIIESFTKPQYDLLGKHTSYSKMHVI